LNQLRSDIPPCTLHGNSLSLFESDCPFVEANALTSLFVIFVIFFEPSSSYSYAPSIPPRIPESPPRSFSLAGSSPPASPPRKVVTDFPTFGSTASAGVFGTAVRSSPFSLAGKQAAFRGTRGGGGGFDVDEDDGEEGPGIGFREDAITLDQARRITMQSAWRNIRS